MFLKRKSIMVIIFFLFLLTGCRNTSFSEENRKEETDQQTSNQYEERTDQQTSNQYEECAESFIENFSQDYPGFELLECKSGTDENAPIQMVAIAKNNENNTSSTLFIIDGNGVGEVVLASDCLAAYRKEDGLYLNKNVISVSFDVVNADGSSEIHDFDLTVTQTENEGAAGTLYTSQETIREE